MNMKRVTVLLSTIFIISALAVCPTSVAKRYPTGYDQYGYNYVAHMYNGKLADYNRHRGGPVTSWTEEITAPDGTTYTFDIDTFNTKLIMKWNDQWLSPEEVFDAAGNVKIENGIDDDGDGVVDEYGEGRDGDYSNSWLTNHFVGVYSDSDGTWHFTLHYKIVYTGPGSPLWGLFTVIQTVFNDDNPATPDGLMQKLIPTGLGFYTRPA